MKKYIIGFIIGGIICTSIGVYAAMSYQASEITYKNTTVDQALDDLYSLSNASGVRVCKYESNEYGNSNDHYSVGTEYICDVSLNGTIQKSFYVLNVSGETVTLIMKQNLTQGTNKTTYTWMEARNYVDNLNWNVRPDLPSINDIAMAVGNNSWKVENSLSDSWFCFGTGYNQKCGSDSGTLKDDANTLKSRWLFNYLKGCVTSGCDSDTNLSGSEAHGYWARNSVLSSSNKAWLVRRGGQTYTYDITNNTYFGVRPVITVLKSNLYE